MPYASKSQARAMHAKAERGEIKKSVVSEFDHMTDFAHLPEHARHKANVGRGSDGGAAGSHEHGKKKGHDYGDT